MKGGGWFPPPFGLYFVICLSFGRRFHSLQIPRSPVVGLGPLKAFEQFFSWQRFRFASGEKCPYQRRATRTQPYCEGLDRTCLSVCSIELESGE